MSRFDRFALLLSLAAALCAYLVADRVFERMAHIEDEMAYVWQAQAIARGHLTVASPEDPKSFLVPFVVDYQGQRFGKYPLGWPAVLSLGLLLGVRSLVNPFLAGAGVWLTYRLGQRTLGPVVGLLAAGLTITSPFFLMNSGSLLSHPLGLVLSEMFVLAWLDAFYGNWSARPRLATAAAAASLGLLALTRPMTAVGIAFPFGLHGLYLLARGDKRTRLRLLGFVGIVLAVSSLYFVGQYAVTGDPLFNPYTLWWKYDRIGFGPGIGRAEGGHTLEMALVNARFSLGVGYSDLFGWARFSWIFLPFGLLAARRNRGMLLIASAFVSLVWVYMLYWIGSALFGPRYYYEGLFCLTLLSAAGIAYLADWPIAPGEAWKTYTGRKRLRPLAVTALVAFLVGINLAFYVPGRLGGMYHLYQIGRFRLEPFLSPQAQQYTPALVIVHPIHEWTEYGALLELQTPFLDTPFLFVHTRGEYADEAVASHFPGRAIFHYYPDEPYTFYTNRRP